MKLHGLVFTSRWLTVAALLAVLAAHGIILHLAATHLALSATAMAVLVGLVVLKHTGFLGAALAWVRRRGGK